MRQAHSKAQSRREFFRAIGRGAALGGLALLTAVLARRKAEPAGRQACVNRGICRGCGALARCGLPAALSARQALSERRS
jgi:hypothetical protein